MKHLLFFLLLCSLGSYAQNMETYKLNKIVPMTPEGAKFANYFFTPPVSATGSVPIDIPLYELNVDGVKIPISLSYQTSGIRVTDLSGSVGLGWSLNVGGGVYRSINGLPDDNESNNPITSTFLDPKISMSDYTVDKVNLKYNESLYQPFVQQQTILAFIASNNGYDINQDNYTYNFLGRNGGLIFNSQLELKQLSDNKLNFSYDSKFLNHFLAKDDQGNNYKFATKEKTNNNYYSSGSSNTSLSGSVYGTTAWKLSEITTVHNKKINFAYADYSTSYNYPSSNSVYHIKIYAEEPQIPDCFSEKTLLSTSYANIQNTNKLITSVTSSDATVLFSYSDNPNASNWKRKLDKIQVLNQNGEVIKTIKFEYTLFNGDPRLKLSKLIFEEANNSSGLSTYSFLYHEEKDMPQVNTMAKDIFGFYNGYNNGTLLKLMPQALVGTQLSADYFNSNREVEENSLKIGSLKQITYPTSGGMKLYYSANRSNQSYAPGLRVDKLELFDSGGTVVNTKFYEYSDLEGQQINFPDYPIRTIPVDINLWQSLKCFSYSSENTLQRSHRPANFFYKKVVIKEIDNGKESTTVEYYNEPNLYQTNEPLEGYVFQPILTGREFYRGNYLTGKKVKSEGFQYNQIVSQTDSVNIYEALPAYYMNAFLRDVIHPCFSYNPGLEVKQVIRAKRLRLDSQSETYYFDDNSSISSSTSYYYDNPNHTYATRTVSNRSDGSTTVRKSSYPHDMVALGQTEPYQEMVSRNITSIPIKSESYIGNVFQESSTTAFARNWPIDPTLIAPKYVKTKVGNENEETRMEFNAYDAKGNIRSVTSEGKVTTNYVWGNNENYVVAQVKNADLNEISVPDPSGSSSFFYGNVESPVDFYYSDDATAPLPCPVLDLSYQIGVLMTYGMNFQANKTYVLSYWEKNGLLGLYGSNLNIISNKLLKTKGDWKLRQMEFTYVGNQPLQINFNEFGLLQDMKIYPKDAEITTYTHKSLVGMTSQTDAKGMTTYYEYDGFQRLKQIKDQNGNVIKTYTYHLKN